MFPKALIHSAALAIASLWMSPLSPTTLANDQGYLSGTIVAADGGPVAGARVYFFPPDPELPSTRSDGDGRFLIGPAPPQHRIRRTLVIEDEQYARASHRAGTLSVFPGRTSDMGTIRLDAGRVFDGQVIDFDGSAISGAMVRVHSCRYEQGHTIDFIGEEYEIETDAKGRFSTPPLPVGWLQLHVRVPNRQIGFPDQLVPIGPPGRQALDPIQLERDFPVEGTVLDEADRPVPGVSLYGWLDEIESDHQGRFVFRGLPLDASFQALVNKEGYVSGSYQIERTDDGISTSNLYGDRWSSEPSDRLVLHIHRVSWMDVKVVDAVTDAPIKVGAATLCFFERRPDGSVIKRGCRLTDFESRGEGRLRIPYGLPAEYVLTVSAEGYKDSEMITPHPQRLSEAEVIEVRMQPEGQPAERVTARQRLWGSVSMAGQPLDGGFIASARLGRLSNVVNARIVRGRTVPHDMIRGVGEPISEGTFDLDVPWDGDVYLLVDHPERGVAVLGPFTVEPDSQLQLQLECPPPGAIHGQVDGVPSEWRGHVWVVAFHDSGLHFTARAEPSGQFSFPQLPPGKYGFKAGHDALLDSEVPRGELTPAMHELPADPWRRATVVELAPNDTRGDVKLRWSAE